MFADSRAPVAGAAFAAVRGARADGHSFVEQVLSAGAPFVVVERADAIPHGSTGVVVDDTVAALGRMADNARRMLRARVVGITGSTGKTLTKDLLAAALGTSMQVHAAPASFNTDVTVPLVVLSCPNDVQVFVAELGARGSGQIAALASIVRPDVGVITGIGTTHIEKFGSRQVIARTKSELLAALPADGVAVVPSNDDFLSTLARSTVARMVTVGPGGHVRYCADRIASDGRTFGRVWIDGAEIEVVLPVPGRALMRNAALALAVARELGVDALDAAGGIAEAKMSNWRMQIVDVGGRTVVNDAWNANPTSTAATLRAVRELAGDRATWAVLGRMAELGATAPSEHRRIGRLAAALGYAGVVVVMGEHAELIAAGAGTIARTVGSVAEAADAVRRVIPRGAVVAVKASRAVGLERLVEQLEAVGAETRT
jgi:UDP-N-acetylmuramoyl-tripeptide--D-alanyl-D-alanine ligase